MLASHVPAPGPLHRLLLEPFPLRCPHGSFPCFFIYPCLSDPQRILTPVTLRGSCPVLFPFLLPVPNNPPPNSDCAKLFSGASAAPRQGLDLSFPYPGVWHNAWCAVGQSSTVMHSVSSANPSSAPLSGLPTGLGVEILGPKSDSMACPADAESYLPPSTASPRVHLNSGHLRSETGSDEAGLQNGVQLQTQSLTN